MTLAILAVCVLAFLAVTCIALRAVDKLTDQLTAAREENKRLVAIITAPTPVAAHVAALDRPRRDEEPPPKRHPIGM